MLKKEVSNSRDMSGDIFYNYILYINTIIPSLTLNYPKKLAVPWYYRDGKLLCFASICAIFLSVCSFSVSSI